MTWQDDIDNLRSQITTLETYKSTNLVNDITVSQNPSSDAQRQALSRINSRFSQYQQVNTRLSELIKQNTPTDIGSTLSTIGTNQQKIGSLKQQIKAAKSDVDVAQERDSQIQMNPTHVSEYQGISVYFGLTKPLHKISVPILFGVSIFLLICAILLLKENLFAGITLPSISGPGATNTSFIRDPRLYGTLFGAACVVIIFLVLKMTNKLPVLSA